MKLLHCKYMIHQHNKKMGVILFPLTMRHADIHVEGEILSAGRAFIDSFVGSVEVYGRSFSLHIVSNPQDKDEIKRAFLQE